MPHEAVSVERLRETIGLSQPTKSSRKKVGFIRKAYRPNKKRFARKSIGSLKKQRSGLSGSHQPRRHAMKTPLLSRVINKALLTKPIKLLVPVTKKHSGLVTPVSAAELLRRQQANLGYFPAEAPFKPGKPDAITDSATDEEQMLAGNESSVHHEVVFIKRFQRTNIKSSQATKPFSKKAAFVKKAYQPDKRRFSRKNIDSLKKQHSGLSGSHQPRCYATKTDCLSPSAGRALLTKKRVKLLAPEGVVEQISSGLARARSHGV